MDEPVRLLEWRHDPEDPDAIEVLSPGVGWWSAHPHAGALVGPGSRVGFLETQNRRVALVLPDGAGGRLRGETPRERVLAVEFGQVLFRLSAARPDDRDALDSDGAALGHPPGAGLPEGTRAVLAPTDGVFYARPAPDTDPFVTVGSTVRSGDAVGLVEVMKTFNQIAYGGPGFSEQARVEEIRVSDGEEIHAGQILIVVR